MVEVEIVGLAVDRRREHRGGKPGRDAGRRRTARGAVRVLEPEGSRRRTLMHLAAGAGHRTSGAAQAADAPAAALAVVRWRVHAACSRCACSCLRGHLIRTTSVRLSAASRRARSAPSAIGVRPRPRPTAGGRSARRSAASGGGGRPGARPRRGAAASAVAAGGRRRSRELPPRPTAAGPGRDRAAPARSSAAAARREGCSPAYTDPRLWTARRAPSAIAAARRARGAHRQRRSPTVRPVRDSIAAAQRVRGRAARAGRLDRQGPGRK